MRFKLSLLSFAVAVLGVASQADAASCSAFVTIKSFDARSQHRRGGLRQRQHEQVLPEAGGRADRHDASSPPTCKANVTKTKSLQVKGTGGKMSVTQVRTNFEGKMLNDVERPGLAAGQARRADQGQDAGRARDPAGHGEGLAARRHHAVPARQRRGPRGDQAARGSGRGRRVDPRDGRKRDRVDGRALRAPRLGAPGQRDGDGRRRGAQARPARRRVAARGGARVDRRRPVGDFGDPAWRDALREPRRARSTRRTCTSSAAC